MSSSKSKSAAHKTVKADAPAPASPKDTIARNRILSFAPANDFPSMPDGYKPTDVDERRRRLRPVPGGLVAECLRATREIAAKSGELRADLGDLAPDPAPAGPIAERIETLEGALAHQRALLACYSELEDIALTDAVELLEGVREEYEHRLKKVPALATKYPMLAAFFQARSSAVTEGIARWKAGAEHASKAEAPKTEAPKIDA